MTDITSTPATSVAGDPLAFYVRLGEPTVDADGVRTSRVRSTVHAQGAWREEEMHMAAVSGLLLHEVDSSQARRVSTVRPRAWSTDSTSSMVRPGRRVRVTTSSSPDQSVPRMS